MRVRSILIAVAVCLVCAPSASAACPISEPDCGIGGGEEFGSLDVSVSTTPAATAANPGWDDENLTYTATVSNGDGINDATNVVVTSQFTAGSATLVSSSASQGSCSGLTCNLGTIAASGSATVTIVVRPAAGTLTNKITATSTIKKACGRYKGRTRKAKLKYTSCVKAVTRKR
jgi:uncharacterized repeat protein (TIGR01451 family)